MTLEETQMILKELYGYFPNTKIPDAQQWVSNYYSVLGEYGFEEILKAAKLCTTECKFFPRPAEIKNRVFKANLMYGDIQTHTKRIAAPVTDYTSEQFEWLDHVLDIRPGM